MTRAACCLAMYGVPHHLISYILPYLPCTSSRSWVIVSAEDCTGLHRNPILVWASLGVSPWCCTATWIHAGPLWGSLMCITLHHRNMQISARSELMHQGSNCWCVASFAFRREHKHRGISAVLSCETPGSVPWYTQCEVALFHQYILTEPWWATSRSPCTGPRVTKANHVCAGQP